MAINSFALCALRRDFKIKENSMTNLRSTLRGRWKPLCLNWLIKKILSADLKKILDYLSPRLSA